jgi:TCP-1/cpn60 chaperonin family protein
VKAFAVGPFTSKSKTTCPQPPSFVWNLARTFLPSPASPQKKEIFDRSRSCGVSLNSLASLTVPSYLCTTVPWPARQIAVNAGEDGSVILGKILEKDQYAYGFDSQTGEYGNLVSKGIIDPTKVVRAAIQNAASVAALLITTEAMIAELPKKGGAGAGGMPPGGGMGGMDF